MNVADYPILQNQKVIGALRSRQEGLYTIFTARCNPIAERLRLSVFGEGEQAYLGLMLPGADGKLFLRRRLSRLERSRLPETILYAAEAGTSQPAPEPPQQNRWRRSPDGTLRLEQAGKRYAAIPLERVAAPGVKPELLKTIGGRRYLVFCLGTW